MSKNIGKNDSIKCTVTSCQNHSQSGGYCALDVIEVGTHETDPAMEQCTDCQSFENINPREQRQAVQQSKMEQGGQMGGQGWS